MKTIATVISVNGTLATVETDRTSACEGCHKQAEGESCSVCTLMGGNARKFTALADNAIGASVGDRVTVETSSGQVLAYALMVFILPLVTAAVGLLIGWFAFRQPLAGGIGAAVGFALAFVFLRIFSSRLKSKKTDVVITEILTAGK